MSRPASIIDDTDASIEYSGAWVLRGPVSTSSEEYNRTAHRSVTAGDSLKYRFRGSGISVYGTLVYPMNGAPVSRFMLDDGPAVALNSTGNLVAPFNSSFWSHALFFNATTSTDTEHTLSITVDEASLTFPFHFDCFIITGAQGRRNVIIDDKDPTIAYTGVWKNTASYREYLGTNHKSPSTPGGTATMQFNGTSIAVHGNVDNDPWSQMSFTLDSSPPTAFVPPSSGLIPRHGVMYSVNDLPSGMHNLTVTNINESPFYIDYFIYDTTEDTSSSSPYTIAPSASTSTDSSGTTSVSQQSTSSASSPPTGAIVGGVVGGLAVVAIIAFLFYFIGRRGRTKGQVEASPANREKAEPNTFNDPSTANVVKNGARRPGISPYPLTLNEGSSVGEGSSQAPTEYHPVGVSRSEKSRRDSSWSAPLSPGASLREPVNGTHGQARSRGELGAQEGARRSVPPASEVWSASEVTSPSRIASPPPAYMESGTL